MLYKIWIVITYDFDILHTTCGHRPAQLVPALIARYLRKRPTVDEWWEWYGSGGRANYALGLKNRLIGLYDRILELPSKNLYSAVIVISSKLKTRLKKQSHVHVLHGGVEVDHLTPVDKREARKRLGLSSADFIIGLVSVGRSEHQDLLPFLTAFRQIIDKEPRLRLFVTGEVDYINEEVINAKCGNRIIYRGWLELEQYSLYLAACDIFALPISNTPRNAGRWPHKIGDFLYLGRPLITNPTGDLAELFKGRRIGYLCPNKKDAYLELIPKLLQSGNHALTMACSDSRTVALELSSDRRVERLEAIYRSVCTQG